MIRREELRTKNWTVFTTISQSEDGDKKLDRIESEDYKGGKAIMHDFMNDNREDASAHFLLKMFEPECLNGKTT